jgi:hypothetical protein
MSPKLLLPLLLVACGPSPDWLEEVAAGIPEDHLVTEIDLPCLGLVRSEFRISAARLARNLVLARQILDEHGLVPRKDFCPTFETVPVVIRSRAILKTTEAGSYIGWYNWFTGIELENTGRALLHELLHHWDAIHLQVGTYWHKDWDTNGYDNADDAYWVASESFRDPGPL